MEENWKSSRRVGRVQELKVYIMAFETAMKIYFLTKKFPIEERYDLVSQIRRSSRSVCSNLSEAWRKRRYPAVFRNKLSDCSQEAGETQTWLEFALGCEYITQELFEDLNSKYEQIFAMLIGMDRKVQSFCK